MIDEGCASRDRAAAILAAFKRDYPTLVRAVKTRETAQTVLMHKLRFINSMSKAGLLEEKEKNLMLVRTPPSASCVPIHSPVHARNSWRLTASKITIPCSLSAGHPIHLVQPLRLWSNQGSGVPVCAPL